MGELSIFIYESGDFGETRDVRDYYLVTFVFHDQSRDISHEISKLEETVRLLNNGIEYIHTGPIIRKEDVFRIHSLDTRRRMIYTIFNFAMKCPVCYYTIAIKRKEASDRVQLSGNDGDGSFRSPAETKFLLWTKKNPSGPRKKSNRSVSIVPSVVPVTSFCRMPKQEQQI